MDRAGTAPVGSDAGDAERPLADQLVTLDLDDANAGEASRLERAPEIHDAIDLGSLAGGAALPRERGILAAAIDEDVPVPMSARWRSQTTPSWSSCTAAARSAATSGSTWSAYVTDGVPSSGE